MLVFSCGGKTEGQFLDNPEQFKSFIEKNSDALIVDVRTAAEFKEGYIEGAININFYDSDFGEKLKRLDNQRPVLVYCAGGVRSSKASETLEKLGFENIHDLKGGFSAWTKKGLPVKY